MFQDLSTDAKTLYGILLDRMSLSVKNEWFDKKGRVFIIFTIEDVKRTLRCADNKATRLLRELEEFGLIERKRRGQGKPCLVYVKNFSAESSKESVKNRNNDDILFLHLVWYTELDNSEVVNLELEVLKMKIIIIFIDLLMATVLFFVGRFFIKSRNTERSVLFLSGDYTGLNTEKICRVTGKRIKTWAMLFCLGGIIDFIKPGAGIIIVSVFFIILLVFHLVDMTINRDKYRV